MFAKRLCLIVIVSLCFISFYNLTLAQTWTQITPSGNTPYPRNSQSAIYDTVNNCMTIFGGYVAESFYENDVWGLSNANGLGETPAWIELFPTGNTPSGRFGHSAIYDSANNRMTMFGGYDGTFKNDVWVLNNANGQDTTTPTWTQLSPSGSFPAPRLSHSAIYDNANNCMVIFGGNGDTTDKNDVWVLSNANGLDSTTSTWKQLSPIGSLPATRTGHTAVYDVANNRMTIFGGWHMGTDLNDVWVLSNANGLDTTTSAWTQLFPTGSAPTSRDGHTAVYDATNNRMTIFGGENGDVEIVLNDVWVLSNANGLGGTPAWTQLLPIGNIPSARVGHSAVYDSNNNRMTIYGDSSLSDIWVLSDANDLTTSVPKSIWELLDQ